MFKRIRRVAKKVVLNVRYNVCAWGLSPYNGMTTDQLRIYEKHKVLEILEEMRELDEQLADILREAGDLEGLLTLQQNSDMCYEAEQELKRSLFSVA